MARASMPLHADYLAETLHLSAAEHGAYLLLMLHYWQRGGLPDDDEQLRRMARMTPRQWQASKTTLAALFGPAWTHARLDAELEKAQTLSRMRAACGKHGGVAKALKTQGASLAIAKQLPGKCQAAPSGQPHDAPNSLKNHNAGLAHATSEKTHNAPNSLKNNEVGLAIAKQLPSKCQEARSVEHDHAPNSLKNKDAGVAIATEHERLDIPKPYEDSSLTSEINNNIYIPPLLFPPSPSPAAKRRRAVAPSAEFLAFWGAYPKRAGANPREPAWRRWQAAVASGADPVELIAAARRYADAVRKEGQLGSPYVAQAVTWLGQRRWLDYPESPAADATAQTACGVWIAKGSPEWDAWGRYRRSRGEPWGASCEREHDRNAGPGWYCPTRWPPDADPSNSPPQGEGKTGRDDGG